MKKLIIALIASWAFPSVAMADIDPVLAVAVETETWRLDERYKENKKLRDKILAAEAVIGVGLEQIHKTEEKILEYMSHASSAVQNAYQIKEIAMITADIYNQCASVKDAITSNPRGAVLASIGSKKVKEASEEIISCSTMLRTLILTGKMNYGDKEKVNLLSAAERYYLLNSIYSSLSKVRADLWLFACQVRYWTVTDLWMHLDYKSWALMIGMQSNAKYVIRMWNQTFNE